MSLRVILLASILLLLHVPVNAAGSGKVMFTAGPSGLTALSYSGVNLLKNGDWTLDDATLTANDGTSAPASRTPTRQSFDVARSTITRTYDWGTQSCTYRLRDDRLEIAVRTRNDTDKTLGHLHLTLLTLAFPQPPTGWQPDVPYLGANRGDPTIEYANFGVGALTVCNDDVTQPLLVGFPGRASAAERPVCVYTDNIGVGYLSPFLDPYLHRTIAPHHSDEYRLSLRFGPPTATAAMLAADLYAKLRHDFPPLFRWRDRRAIGSLHLAVTEPQFHSPTNPRGWFGDTKVDVVTPSGQAAFRQRVLQYADDSIANLKKMNAQGMVTWDLEGEEYPQSTTYLGEPRELSVFAPEMNAVADAYFAKFRDAGLRTGLCIRPQKLSHTAAKTEQVELPDDAGITQILYDKMAYANRRWGCTLFYVDSNGDPNVPFDPIVFEDLARKLAAAHIDALVMPEHRDTRYYDCSAPYVELRSGHIATAPAVRLAYPDAFTVVYTPDSDYAKYADDLSRAVRGGDILMFRAWWDDPDNAAVTKAYASAKPSNPSQAKP